MLSRVTQGFLHSQYLSPSPGAICVGFQLFVCLAGYPTRAQFLFSQCEQHTHIYTYTHTKVYVIIRYYYDLLLLFVFFDYYYVYNTRIVFEQVHVFVILHVAVESLEQI